MAALSKAHEHYIVSHAHRISARMSGRLFEGLRIVPPSLWRHLGERLGVAAHIPFVDATEC